MQYEKPKYIAINQWAEEDRPREKLLLKGKSSLSDAELIGILLGSGTKTLSAVDLAKHVLHTANHDLNTLAKMNVSELMQFKGIGEAKAINIVSALELGRRRKASEVQRQPRITTPSEAYELMKPELTDLHHEEFWVILMKRNNTVIKKEQISVGSVNNTLADPKIIFKKALESLASSIILVHNHPSGVQRPSELDNRLTKKLKAASELLDMTVSDHIIFTDEGYFSYSENGLI